MSRALGASERTAAVDRNATVWLVLLIAGGLTLVDAAKPLVIDDGAFYQIARQIAAHPSDPYGFELQWYADPVPAVETVAPPLVPYWWAAAQRLFGDRPLAWKLWLLPFSLLLVASCARLLHHVAPGRTRPLLCIALLSPVVLPALNLMLDLPALALSLASLILVIESCRRARGHGLALLAGLVAGLALQTKYTAAIPLAASLAYAALAGRWALALLTGTAASLVFLGWEAYVAQLYGDSHFVLALDFAPTFAVGSLAQNGLALLCLLGASSPAIALLALRPPLPWSVLLVGVLTLAFAALALLPADPIASVGPVFPTWQALGAETAVLAPVGLLVLASAVWSTGQAFGGRLRARRQRSTAEPALAVAARLELVLLLWVVLEVVGFFVVSPYPALRRVIGLHVALTLLVGSTADSVPAARALPLPAISAWGAALALVFAVSDISDARARREGLTRAVARLDAEADTGARWFVGHWGFFYYAERAGLRSVELGRSRLEPGDWLVFPLGVHRQPLRPPPGSVERVDLVSTRSRFPWSTIPSAYSGYRPIRPQPDMQLQIVLLRVLEPFTASQHQ